MYVAHEPKIGKDTILVFDKDGVIFHSEDIKFEYFLGLFSSYVDEKEAIKNYLIGSGGTPRKTRFKFICDELLGMENSDELVEQLFKKSTLEMDAEILKTKFVAGARQFIEKYDDNKKFVCSGSPQHEVDAHLAGNNIDHYFISAHGGVSKKSVVLLDIKKNHGADIVYFGDTMVDYNAAKEADVTFIGLRSSKYHDPFKELDICMAHSFEMFN